jgi:hypothetical protein
MRRPSRLWLVALTIFALLTIGANDCALEMIGKPVPSAVMPALPCCYTDPPQGCVAVCLAVGPISFVGCNGPASDALAKQFAMDVNTAQATLPGDACDEGSIGRGITPCQDGIAPVELPNQDHTVCMSPPPGCSLTGC